MSRKAAEGDEASMRSDLTLADGAAVDAVPDGALDAVDRRILGLIQSGFPLEARPYALIGESAGIAEEEAFARIRQLRQRGLIRRIGANFQSAKLGFRSTLCAAKVPQDKLEQFIAAVNAEPGVTHNYLRDHAYNVWFTMIAPSWDAVEEALRRISAVGGAPVLNLPARAVYKIKVDFSMEGQ